MNTVLSCDTLDALGARFAILSVGKYALPVRFRIRESAVECRIPTWSGIGDLLEEPKELTLVATVETGAHLRWFLVRGEGTVVPDPDWDGLRPQFADRVSLDDLYHLVRLKPARMELVDEQRGWGFRETVDL